MVHTEAHKHTTDLKGKVRRNSVFAGSGKRATEGKGCKNNKNILYIERQNVIIKHDSSIHKLRRLKIKSVQDRSENLWTRKKVNFSTASVDGLPLIWLQNWCFFSQR